jgi:hypothetical protein
MPGWSACKDWLESLTLFKWTIVSDKGLCKWEKFKGLKSKLDEATETYVPLWRGSEAPNQKPSND